MLLTTLNPRLVLAHENDEKLEDQAKILNKFMVVICYKFYDKVGSHYVYNVIYTIYRINTKFVDELLYLVNRYIMPQPKSLFSNMYHAKVFVTKVNII